MNEASSEWAAVLAGINVHAIDAAALAVSPAHVWEV